MFRKDFEILDERYLVRVEYYYDDIQSFYYGYIKCLKASYPAKC